MQELVEVVVCIQTVQYIYAMYYLHSWVLYCNGSREPKAYLILSRCSIGKWRVLQDLIFWWHFDGPFVNPSLPRFTRKLLAATINCPPLPTVHSLLRQLGALYKIWYRANERSSTDVYYRWGGADRGASGGAAEGGALPQHLHPGPGAGAQGQATHPPRPPHWHDR